MCAIVLVVYFWRVEIFICPSDKICASLKQGLFSLLSLWFFFQVNSHLMRERVDWLDEYSRLDAGFFFLSIDWKESTKFLTDHNHFSAVDSHPQVFQPTSNAFTMDMKPTIYGSWTAMLMMVFFLKQSMGSIRCSFVTYLFWSIKIVEQSERDDCCLHSPWLPPKTQYYFVAF